MFDPIQLWGRRCRSFWKEAAYYWRFIGRSMSQGVLFFAFIAAMYMYIQWLETLPDNFPYYWFTVPLITWAVAFSPIRTFLQPADRAFLLPVESRIGPYLSRALRYSYLWQAATVLVVAIILWPLYKVSKDGSTSFLLLSVFLLIVKWGNVLGSWQEARQVHERSRRLLRFIRWTASTSVVFTVYQYGPAIAGIIGLLWITILWASYKKTNQYPIPWEYLIRKEREHLSKHYLFFSWFIEVDHLPNRVKPRRWLASITGRFPFRQASTYLYLFTKTYIRSETASISVRLTVAGALLLLLVPDPNWKIAVFGIFLWMSCVQMSSLDQYHRYTFWLKLYPVDAMSKRAAIIRIVYVSLLSQWFLLGAVLVWQSRGSGFSLAAVAVSLMMISAYCLIFMRKKLKRTSLQL